MTKKIVFLILGCVLSACSTMSPRERMQSDADQAAAIVERFEAIPERGIPPAVMRAARGVAILTVTKAGFIGSGRGGTGVGGLGIGFQAGVEITEFVIVLNTPAAVEAFAQGGNVTLGGNLSVAAGPIGRSAEGNVAVQAAMYSYSRTQGLFAGISLEGTVIGTRDSVNEGYYGGPVRPMDILTGKVRPPRDADRLISVLRRY